jgi:hypothetical protein
VTRIVIAAQPEDLPGAIPLETRMKAAFSIAPFAAALLLAARPVYLPNDDESDQAVAEPGRVSDSANVKGLFRWIGAGNVSLFAFLSRAVTRISGRRDA